MRFRFRVFLFSLLCLAGQGALAQPRCNQVSDSARRSGNKLLVIAFEGFGQYDQGLIDEVYLAQNFPRGRLPLLGAQRRGVLTAGLLSPLVRRYGHRFELAVLDFTDTAGGVSCVELWESAARGRRVLLVGHSWGAITVSAVASAVAARGLSVDAVLTVDAFAPSSFTRPSRGVAFWANYYERDGGFI
jgi:hypothetical protein